MEIDHYWINKSFERKIVNISIPMFWMLKRTVLLIETVLLSSHNICFGTIFGYVRSLNCLCEYYLTFNPFSAIDYFCHLLINFPNSLDPDQARKTAGSDLIPN